MKRLTLLAKIILIITLGFVSLLHAEADKKDTDKKEADKKTEAGDKSHDDKAGTRYTGTADWKKPFDNYESFLKQVEKTGFESITEYFSKIPESDIDTADRHQVSVADVEKLKKAHEVVLRYRAEVVECAKAKKDDKTSVSLKGFIDGFQKWLTNVFVDTDGGEQLVRDVQEKSGIQITLLNDKQEKLLSYIAAFHEFQKKKSEQKNVNGKLSETSSGDVKLMEQLLSTASILIGKEVKIDEKDGKIGDSKIADLRKLDNTKSIFESMDKITSEMDKSAEACLITLEKTTKPGDKKDENKDPKKEEKTDRIDPKGNPLPGEAGKPGEKNPPVPPVAKAPPTTDTPPVTPPPGGATGPNADAEAQRIANEQAAIAAREAQDRLNRQLEDDEDGQDDLAALGQLIRGLQPNNRSASNERSNQGPQLSIPSPSGAGSGGGDGQQPFVPPKPEYQPPANDGLMAQLLPMLMNRNNGSGDINPQLLRAALENKEKEVPYTAPIAPLVNPRETALLDTIRMMFTGGMAGQLLGGGARPNINGGRAAAIQGYAGGAGSIRSIPMSRMSASAGAQRQLAVPGARGKTPGRVTGSR